MPVEEVLSDYSVNELKTRAKEMGIKNYSKMTKDELIDALKANDFSHEESDTQKKN